jgi:hypothetical protein
METSKNFTYSAHSNVANTQYTFVYLHILLKTPKKNQRMNHRSPIASQDLYSFQRHPGRPFSSEQYNSRTILTVWDTSIRRSRRRMNERPTGCCRSIHVGQFALYELKFSDWLPELLAFLCIGNCHI